MWYLIWYIIIIVVSVGLSHVLMFSMFVGVGRRAMLVGVWLQLRATLHVNGENYCYEVRKFFGPLTSIAFSGGHSGRARPLGYKHKPARFRS